MSDTKNIVIAVAAGYTVEHIRNFVLSFREHNTVDRILFVVDIETKPVLLQFFNEYNVESLVFSSFRFVDSYVNNSRWFAILDYFINSGEHQFKNILLSDARDVCFQSDPFANLPEEFLYFFTEDSGILLGNESINSHWIQVAYGNDALANISNKNVICSGTILGSSKLVFDYTIWVYHEFLKIKYTNHEVFKTNILDQGICNYLAHIAVANNPLLQVKYSGDIIGTVGLSVTRPDVKDIVSIHRGKVLVNGNIPSIIHQYDRSPTLTDLFNKKYADNQRIN